MADENADYQYVNMPGSVPIPQRNDRADLIEKIKPDQAIEFIRQRLLGKEWDENTKTWKLNPSLKEFALTEYGAWELSNLMLGTSSINTTISKYKEEVIKARLKRIARDAQLMAVAKFRAYGIKNSSQLHFIHSLVFSTTLAALSQAGGGSIQELLKGTVTENRNVNSELSKPSMLKRVLGLGGG